jgi:hypothetical protein
MKRIWAAATGGLARQVRPWPSKPAHPNRRRRGLLVVVALRREQVDDQPNAAGGRPNITMSVAPRLDRCGREVEGVIPLSTMLSSIGDRGG